MHTEAASELFFMQLNVLDASPCVPATLHPAVIPLVTQCRPVFQQPSRLPPDHSHTIPFILHDGPDIVKDFFLMPMVD